MCVSDVRLVTDAVSVSMRPSAVPHYRGWHAASPPRKPHQNHHYHHHQQQQQQQQQPPPPQQQQQQVPVKADTEEHIIQPKTTVTTTAAAASTTPASSTPAAGQNPNVRRANAIDRYSRVVFPVVFTVFSITYWTIYINASSSMVNLAGFVVD